MVRDSGKSLNALLIVTGHGGLTRSQESRRAGSFSGPRSQPTLGIGFVPVRKPGKLPHETIAERYTLEYGTDSLEVHRDAIRTGERVLLVDDLLATGGTAVAAAKLVRRLGGTLDELAVVIELTGLPGRERLTEADVSMFALLQMSDS